jgi:tetratricopeptide (TPR) repeat protein
MAKKIPQPPVQKIKKKKNSLFYILCSIVFAISFIFYAKSINNEYALDDGITMEKNEYVHQGFAGIKDIMTKDAMASFFKQLGSKGQLSGGRYRPLSIVTFAVEYELFGIKKGDIVTATGTDGKEYKGKVKKIAPGGEVTYNTKEYGDGMAQLTTLKEFKPLAHIQHFFNVLLYALSMVVLFVFLYQVLFKNLEKKEYWALFVTLVFAMHPLHSEVVANLKSRDEILSLLFILCTLIRFDRYQQKTTIINGVWMAVFFFLAMLSKEYGAVLLIIIPIWIFIEQKDKDLMKTGKKILMSLLPLLVVFIPYILLRLGAVMIAAPGDVKPDVLNDYFMYAKGDEVKATQIYVLLKYFLLQLYPYPLASDYSYSTIAYRHFSSPEVIVSLLIHIGMLVGLGYAILKKRLIMAFALLFYLLNLLLVSNLQIKFGTITLGFNIGASMGERLVYNSSLGLIILVFYGLYLLTKKLNNRKMALYVGGGITALVAIPFFMIVQERCAAWKNDYTLATTDVKIHPNSSLLNANAGTYILNKSDLLENKDKSTEMVLEARKYTLKALEIHPTMANGWMNLAVIEHRLKDYEGAEKAVNKVIEIFPSNPKVPLFQDMVSNDYISVGFEKYKEGKVDSCFMYLYKAKKVGPYNPEVYYNLGGAYLTISKNLDSATYYFTRTLQLNPNHQQASQGLASVKLQMGIK